MLLYIVRIVNLLTDLHIHLQILCCNAILMRLYTFSHELMAWEAKPLHAPTQLACHMSLMPMELSSYIKKHIYKTVWAHFLKPLRYWTTLRYYTKWHKTLFQSCTSGRPLQDLTQHNPSFIRVGTAHAGIREAYGLTNIGIWTISASSLLCYI